jgi:hypothetical protein
LHVAGPAGGGRQRRETIERDRRRMAMCRSIKTLREPFTQEVTDADIAAAALQYVRKVSGFRAPAVHNAAAFERAVAAVTEATRTLLDDLVVRSTPRAQTG